MPTTMDYEFVRCSAMESEDAGETAFYFTVEFDDLTLSVGIRARTRFLLCMVVVFCLVNFSKLQHYAPGPWVTHIVNIP